MKETEIRETQVSVHALPHSSPRIRSRSLPFSSMNINSYKAEVLETEEIKSNRINLYPWG